MEHYKKDIIIYWDKFQTKADEAVLTIWKYLSRQVQRLQKQDKQKLVEFLYLIRSRCYKYRWLIALAGVMLLVIRSRYKRKAAKKPEDPKLSGKEEKKELSETLASDCQAAEKEGHSSQREGGKKKKAKEKQCKSSEEQGKSQKLKKSTSKAAATKLTQKKGFFVSEGSDINEDYSTATAASEHGGSRKKSKKLAIQSEFKSDCEDIQELVENVYSDSDHSGVDSNSKEDLFFKILKINASIQPSKPEEKRRK